MGMNYAEAQYIIDSFNTEYPKQERSGVPISYFDWATSASGPKIFVQYTPVDTTLNGQLISRLGKIVICIKKQAVPSSIDDYTYKKEFDRSSINMDVLNETVFTGMELDKTYYIRLFPISDHSVISYDKRFIQSVVTKSLQVMSFHQDFGNKNPETSITYTGDNLNFTPVNTNSSAGTVTDGSWHTWGWLEKIKPCMVRRNGTFDYELDPTDYTKKKDGTPSDITNANYQGGAFVWFPKIYMKEVYASDGRSRDVYFTDNPNDESTRDFKPIGFTMSDGTIVNGLWIPMYYPGSNWEIRPDVALRNDHTATGGPSVDNLSFSNIRNVWSTGIYFGFPLTNVIRDILYMLYRSANIQAHTGNGTSSEANKLVNSNSMFAVSDGYVKLFHTIIIGSCAAYIWDPYFMTSVYVNNSGNYNYNNLQVPKNYGATRIEIKEWTRANMNGPTSLVTAINLNDYAFKLTYLEDFNTSIPIYVGGGTATTGLCDKIRIYYNATTASGASGVVLIYGKGSSADNGPVYMNATASPGSWPNSDRKVKIPMLIPPSGFDLEA